MQEQRDNINMSVVLYIIGGLVLLYWVNSMSTAQYNRPRIINENGSIILIIGIACIITGYLI